MTVVAASHCLQQDHQCRRNATGEQVQGIRRKIIQKNLKKLEPEKGYTCYLCRQKGHLMRSCPLRNQAKSSLETHNVVVDGKILYFNLVAKILIDTSALHAFIFARFPILVIETRNSGAIIAVDIYVLFPLQYVPLFNLASFPCSFSHRTVMPMPYCIL